MLCDICKKNQATIHIHEIIDGKKKEINLCADCAAKKMPEGIEIGPFNFGELLFNTEKISTPAGPAGTPEAPATPEAQPDVVCRNCAWTLEKIRQSGGRLGCPECYKTFRPMIDSALGTIQKGKVHLGKRPNTELHDSAAALLTLELADKQRELQSLIAAEEYEQAAIARDRIAALKKQLAETDGAAK